MNAILGSHVIDPTLLRADAIEAFYGARKAALLGLVERAMGKASTEASPVGSDDENVEDDADA
jgi:hypothetical protein